MTQQQPEIKLGTFIEAKRLEAGMTYTDVMNETGIMGISQAEIEGNHRYPTERELMWYRILGFLPVEEDSDEESRKCNVCDENISSGGFLAEWSGDMYCSTEHAEQEHGAEDIAEGLEDGTFFWTNWLNGDTDGCKHDNNETLPVAGGETITVCHDCGDEL